jgi:branched-chain amino acid transport system substrate-binding protein
MIVPTTISPPTQPFVFCSAATSQQTTRQTMQSLTAAKLRRAALLILDILATPDRMAIFYQEAAVHGVDLAAVEPFPGSATTLTTHLRALTAQTPDAILVAGPPPFNAMATRELRAMPWPGRIYCSAAAGHPGYLQQAGAASEGVRVVAPWLLLGPLAPDTLPNSWAIRQFVTTFTPQNGPVGTFAGYGADAVTMIHLAYAGHHDRNRARDILEHMTCVGATGVFTMTPTTHAALAGNALTIVTVRNGSWAPDDDQP